jgi:hypothetical protein
MVGDSAIQSQAAKPPISQIEVHLLTQPSLRSDPVAISHQQHPDQKFRVDRGPSCLAIEWRQVRTQLVQINKPVNCPQQVIRRHMPLQGKLKEQSALIHPSFAHHRSHSCFDTDSESASSLLDN